MLNALTLKQIHELVGRISSSWNEVESLWYLIFTILMADTQRAKVDAIYDLFNSNKRQRELIMQIAPIALSFEVAKVKAGDEEHKKRRDLKKQIGQLHAETNKLSGRRNAIIHTAFEDWGFSVVAYSPHKASKLRDENHLKYLTELEEDASLLALNLADLREDLLLWLNPRALDGENASRQHLGLPTLRAVRNTERSRILLAVAQRK